MGLREDAKAAAADLPGDEMQTLGEDHLTDAIHAADWPTVRRIAQDPSTPGEEADRARGALAGANEPLEYALGDTVTVGGLAFTKHADGPLPASENGRHGVPDTHVYDPDEGGYLAPGAPQAELERLRGPVHERPEITTRPTVIHGTPLHLTPQQHTFLLRGIDGNRVKQHRGQSHLEAWDVRRTLNRAFGFGGWDVETMELVCAREIETPPDRPNGRSRWTVVYRAQVRLTIKNPDGTPGAVFEDGASGDSVNQPSLGDAHDQALKTALSQGLKRCAVNLGDQFGMSLYNGGSYDPVVIGTLAGPVVEGGEAVEILVSSTPVRGEQETQQYRDDPGMRPDSDANGMPSAFELRDEACDPATSLDRLRAIMHMVHRSKGTHPHLGATEVTNENGDAEKLDALVHRKTEERKAR